jgi:hypothetical protein
MSKYLDTNGKTSLAVGICDRCHFKMALADMVSDPNSPGLRVHAECKDQFDPYRLAARQPEKITVREPRPDADISLPTGVIPPTL